jgi:hypothetical protein
MRSFNNSYPPTPTQASYIYLQHMGDKIQSQWTFKLHNGIICSLNEEEEPTRRYLVFYYTYDRLNMFRAALCPSSGADDYISDYHMDRLILRLLVVGGLVQVGWLNTAFSPDT